MYVYLVLFLDFLKSVPGRYLEQAKNMEQKKDWEKTDFAELCKNLELKS